MKHSKLYAINKFFEVGIVLTRKQFDYFLRQYNNFEMPLGERESRIAKGLEPEFIKFVKEKLEA